MQEQPEHTLITTNLQYVCDVSLKGADFVLQIRGKALFFSHIWRSLKNGTASSNSPDIFRLKMRELGQKE